MVHRLDSPVSVLLSFDHQTCSVSPRKILFRSEEHKITKIGFHHTYRTGRTLFHVFSVASDTMFFRLILNTDTLHWTLEEISDGEAN